ncbi:LysR family transcriptional regulator [Pseudonocardia abyssalis]|uniref:LysR family transcriptional regulator n=1 Tax=Pseudonocardia abyssalis TaxID=2792008 RepID=A0ABS6UZ71_9PSEU|nr:LysR family transcriptional regulator [Pseudonocardia abyssalis]MBW0114250.1 LysR family transcriptional regulator [Pseudonocardia abyssalis]MBW0137276.1 LysR family transcriptional regulator [Pseudonocardia abyssalis]
MDEQKLRVFVAIAEELHFGRAADRLYLAQPHVSRSVRALEAELGAEVFRRTTRTVELTPAGTALLPHAHALLARTGEARAAVVAARDGRSGRVRISFAGPSAHVVVGQLARAVREQHPLVDLEFLPGRYGTAAVAELLGNESDLALARFAQPPVGVAGRSVARDRCVVAVPVGHRLAVADEVRIADFRDEPVVAFPESFGSAVRAMFVERCHAAGFAPRFAQSAPDSWTATALVSAGVGLHFTTASAIEHLPLEGVRVRQIADRLPAIDVFLTWRRDDDSPVLHRVLQTSWDVFPGDGAD